MIRVGYPIFDEKEEEAVIEVLRSGRLAQGPVVAQFEEKFEEWNTSEYAISCSNCTAALHMSLLSLGIKNGDEVIVPPVTFFSTISSVLMCNANPIFVGLDGNMCIDPEEVEKAITEKTKAIICVHIMGHPCNMNELVSISRKYQIPLIEDCAQAHGAEYENMKVGNFGYIGCFSFYATKNMTTGEGGIITTNRYDIYEKIKLYRNHGMINSETHSIIGYNYRMTEIEAAIGIVQLDKIDKFNNRRREIANYYYDNLDNPGIIYAPFEKNKNINPSYFVFPIICNWGCFPEYLRGNKIEFRQRYKEPLYKQPIFKNKYSNLDLKGTNNLSFIYGLPCHPGLTDEEIKYIVEVLNKFPQGLK